MKHIQRHAFQIFFDNEHFRKGGYDYQASNLNELQYELAMFRKSWKNAKTLINFGQGGSYVEISYENFQNCEDVCYEAAENFRQVVSRNHWWKEVSV